MKILEVIPQLSTGGAERFVVDLCNELSADNEVLLVVLWPLKGDQSFFLKQISDKVSVESLEKHPGMDFRVFFKLRRIIRKFSPDVIHSHIDAIIYSGVFQSFSRKGVHTVHSLARHEAGGLVQRCLRQLFFKCGRVKPVTISKEAQKDFESFYHIQSRLICNGRNVPQNLVVSDDVRDEIARYKNGKSTRVIIQLAHVDRIKRQHIMAKVAGRLVEEGFDFCVLFIGSDSRIPSYTDEVKSVMPDNCHFLGERHNPLEYLKCADALGLCSSVEGFPISIIEALGVGAVPICTPVGGIPDVISDGGNGILSSGITEEEYYDAVKRFLQLSPDALHKMSDNAIKSYAQYSMKECARNYLDFFKTIG